MPECMEAEDLRSDSKKNLNGKQSRPLSYPPSGGGGGLCKQNGDCLGLGGSIGPTLELPLLQIYSHTGREREEGLLQTKWRLSRPEGGGEEALPWSCLSCKYIRTLGERERRRDFCKQNGDCLGLGVVGPTLELPFLQIYSHTGRERGGIFANNMATAWACGVVGLTLELPFCKHIRTH
jgi:hypothetical protein